MKTIKLHQLIPDMSSEQYHSTPGTWSSSQLKDLHGNLEHFVKKYIKKEVEREELDAFDVGTYFHTKVLEPHKLKLECVVYPGRTKRGKQWELFKKKNKGKAIVTLKQREQAEGIVKAVLKSKVCKRYLKGTPEVSLFTELLIYKGDIFAPKFKKQLTRKGWVSVDEVPTKGFKVIVKVRADMLGSDFISDLKSTTGDAQCEESMEAKVKYYKYDLSAALYLDMFSLLNPKLKELWWLFSSKDLLNARAHECDPDYIKIGRAKYIKSLRMLALLAKNNWETPDLPGKIRPGLDQRAWLLETDSELL